MVATGASQREKSLFPSVLDLSCSSKRPLGTMLSRAVPGKGLAPRPSTELRIFFWLRLMSYLLLGGGRAPGESLGSSASAPSRKTDTAGALSCSLARSVPAGLLLCF